MDSAARNGAQREDERLLVDAALVDVLPEGELAEEDGFAVPESFLAPTEPELESEPDVPECDVPECDLPDSALAESDLPDSDLVPDSDFVEVSAPFSLFAALARESLR